MLQELGVVVGRPHILLKMTQNGADNHDETWGARRFQNLLTKPALNRGQLDAVRWAYPSRTVGFCEVHGALWTLELAGER